VPISLFFFSVYVEVPVKKMLYSFLLATFLVLPTQAKAGGHAGSFNLNLSIQSRGYYAPRPYYPPYYRGFRPVCPVGFLSPGCFAPVRKTGFFLGVAGFRVARGVARGAFFAARVATFPARALFGRRYY